MGTLLRRAAFAAALASLVGAAVAEESSDRNRFQLEIDAGYVSASSPFHSWTEGGLGKLRYSESNDGLKSTRVFAQYRGRIGDTLSATVIADYQDDASAGLDVTEAYMDWRPIPKSANQQQVRFGAFYPPFSLENADLGWQSPFTYSYSAVNTWLGEEIRPMGVEWSLHRHLGFAGSPQELRAFASAFYGNDPAGTLLFWRGWSLHDRQTRLNDQLPMPPHPIWDSTGTVVGYYDQTVEPVAETDHKPGAYAGLEWGYARRVRVQLARYENRADPYSFASGQWGWDTEFNHLGVQANLPWQLGLVAQWLEGETYWVQGARPDGTLSPVAALVGDAFSGKFLLLTRLVHGSHRVSLRRDAFDMHRESGQPAIVADHGDAWTLAYRYEHSAHWSGGIEWLRIDSSRGPWEYFYAAPEDAKETQVRADLTYRLGVAQR
jgi:phosphate-selective porin O/P